jgi:valyl-tRNA synthetase
MSTNKPIATIDPAALPKHYEAPEFERLWAARWSDWNLYAYDPSRPREETFVIDTPPPTVSGALHIGHIFSYTHQDVIARFMRMRGRNIFYPMGWDDNGLPSERRAEKFFHIRCAPKLPYEANLALPPATAKGREAPVRNVSRKNFIEHCDRLVEEDERGFQELWTRTGLSVDWKQTYRTNGERARRLAQWSFLDLAQKRFLYNASAPTMWDVDFQSAVAQAEVEDRPVKSAYYDIAFRVQGSDEQFSISTTRPELLAACVAVTAHPDDARYRHLFGKSALTPIFGAPVRIFPSERVDPEQGSGIVMVCTFGDATDVQWWREEKLPLLQVLGKDGRFVPVDFAVAPFASVQPGRANEFYATLVGQRVNKARELMIAALSAPGSSGVGDAPASSGAAREIVHPVKFYEKGDRPLEFMVARQWFVSLLDKKPALLEKGNEIAWHPPFMRERFLIWTQNLQYDWCVSRQRYFGVPLPVWYPVDAAGQPRFDAPIIAAAETLPVDPMIDTPPGFSAEQRDQPQGFSADPDVFDTWFTSSLTPQVSTGWIDDPGRHASLFPGDVRPQGHEIIRTWAFYTIAKSLLHGNTVPWHNVLISGWILDPERKKMSKSKGNVVAPANVLDTYSADAVRYWAARAKLGTDAIFDESVFKIGKRLTTKLYNAAKLVLGFPAASGPITHDLDRSFVEGLRALVASATEHFNAFDASTALRLTEDFFWKELTDSYAELTKPRARGEFGPEAQTSAVVTLRLALSVLLRLFAPIIPYVSEEIWSWCFAAETGHKSVHIAPWPSEQDFAGIAASTVPGCFPAAIDLYASFNRAKTEFALSRKASLQAVRIHAAPDARRLVLPTMTDLAAALHIERYEFEDDPTPGESPYRISVLEYREQPVAEP